MQDLSAKRTLVKSLPELWDELSEVERLAKHLGAFGEIKITKLEPEHTVAWEGEHASGTVSIEPSGWGTKVILRAELAAAGDPADERGEAAEADPTIDHGADAAHADPDEAETMDDAHPPVAELTPAAALALDVAGAPTAGSGNGASAGGRTNRLRRRRGFWARLFGSWLVPEERLNREVVEPVDEAAEDRIVEPDGRSTEDQPPDRSAERPVAPATEALATEVEVSDRPAEEEAESVPEEPVAAAPAAIDREGARAVLEETLDALGSAHHRPYSRS
jgi:hypothetical protein